MNAILLHLYYQDLWPEFKEKILPILSESTHLYVSINAETEYTNDIRSCARETFLVENRGMDFGPFVFVYDKLQHLNYNYIVKLHGKKSVHAPGIGDHWRKSLVNSIMASPIQFHYIINYMQTDTTIYMAAAREFYYDITDEPLIHPNRLAALPFINKVRRFLNSEAHGSFFAGSMFIVTTEYLDKLFESVDLEVLYEQFEPGYLMDSFAHGMERVIGYGVKTHNGKYLTI